MFYDQFGVRDGRLKLQINTDPSGPDGMGFAHELPKS